jgi:hypothetical protein
MHKNNKLKFIGGILMELNNDMLQAIQAIFDKRNDYWFIDKTKDVEDDYYEFCLSAESILEAWDILKFDRDRYDYVAGPEGHDDDWIFE